ncbi:MAG: hypothetical protein ACOCP8_05770 [archaeon]
MILEQIKVEKFLSGKESFRIFLFIVNKSNVFFIKKNYLNTNGYYYFYYTGSIEDNDVLLNELRLKDSLRASYLTLKKIKHKKLSFYIGVKGNIFEYGFYDVSNKIVYKTGKFKVTNSFFKNLPQHQSFKTIRNSLRGANLKVMKYLHSIIDEINEFWNHIEGKVKFVDGPKIKKSFKKEDFTVGELIDYKITKTAINFIKIKGWDDKLTAYTVIGDNKVYVYFTVIDDVFENYNFI